MKHKPKKKSSRSNWLLIGIFVVGLSLLLYPTVANWWNSFHSTRAIEAYDAAVAEMSQKEFAALRAEADAWNAELARDGGMHVLTDSARTRYDALLNVSGSGVMGYIEIPKLRVKLPIYHGVDEKVLQIAVGHLEMSSLPVGGESTHCVLSGHRGLPSARLFTDLDQMHEGDRFLLHTLNETLTYEVDQIRTVLPTELEELQIEPGEDLCTLVTCTPYGVNTHRLLVRWHRVENDDETYVVSEANRFDPVEVMPFVAAPLLLALLVWLLWSTRKKKSRGGDAK